MIRNYKGLGLALMAMLALGAIAAQGASANPLTVSGIAAGGTVHITGTTDKNAKGESSIHTLVVEPGLEVKCTHALYHGHAVVGVGGVVNHMTLGPEYTGCSAFGFATAHVKVNGCTYTLTTPTKIGIGEVTWDASATPEKSQIHVICPVGKKIEITPTSFGVSVCTAFVGEQTPAAGHLVARNHGPENEMTITDEATVEGVTYTSTNNACGKGGSTAKFTGNTTATCYSNEAHTIKVNCTFS